MKHKVASRFNEKYLNDKCPKCGFMNHNFIFISEKELACYSCGTMFINYETRMAMKPVVKQMLTEQEQDRSAWTCTFEGCTGGDGGGVFKAKSKAGLTAHMKVHNNGN